MIKALQYPWAYDICQTWTLLHAELISTTTDRAITWTDEPYLIPEHNSGGVNEGPLYAQHYARAGYLDTWASHLDLWHLDTWTLDIGIEVC